MTDDGKRTNSEQDWLERCAPERVEALEQIAEAASEFVRGVEVFREQQLGTATRWVRLRAVNQDKTWKAWQRLKAAVGVSES